jgi:hypothetical protein
MPLRLGLFSMNSGPRSHPDAAARIARAAEAAGSSARPGSVSTRGTKGVARTICSAPGW